jgi:hypothetical protein
MPVSHRSPRWFDDINPRRSVQSRRGTSMSIYHPVARRAHGSDGPVVLRTGNRINCLFNFDDGKSLEILHDVTIYQSASSGAAQRKPV